MNSLNRLLLNILLGASVVSVLAATQLVELIAIATLGSIMLISYKRHSFERFSRACAAGSGLLVPVIPWIGTAPLITLVLLLGIVTQGSSAEGRPYGRWAAPLLAYGFGSVCGEIVQALSLIGGGGSSFLRGLVVDSPSRVMDVWRALSEVHAHSWAWCVHLLVASLVVDFFSGEPLRRRFFVRGLFYATGISALFALTQWFGVIPFNLPNQTPFWTSIQRVSGLMSDPNALGVVMGLSLWCLALGSIEFKTRMGLIEVLWVSLVVMAGVVSGSRTFLLACAILTIALTWHLSRRFFLAALGSGVAVVCAVTAIDLYSPALEYLQAHTGAPEGIRRGVLSLSLLRASQTFASRTLFLDLAKHLIDGHAMFGVGAERFRDYVPLIGVHSGLVKGWTDNANNLYVGLIVEVGIVGLLLFAASLANRTRSAFGRVPLATAVLWGLGALMMTGPHIDFPEVLILVAFLIGATTVDRQVTLPRGPAMAAVAAILGLYASTTREQGVFGWHESAGAAERWLSNRATIHLECRYGEDGALAHAATRLRAMYVPQRAPLEVKVFRGTQITQTLLFRRAQDDQELQVRCENEDQKVDLTLITLPPWSPYRAWPEQSGDRRILGIQQVEIPRL